MIMIKGLITAEKILTCKNANEVGDFLAELIKKEIYYNYPKQKYIPLLSSYRESRDEYIGLRFSIDINFPIQREWDF